MVLPASIDLRDYIRNIPDFPKPGVMFKDITPLLGSPLAFRTAIEQIEQHFQGQGIDVIAAAEARGFIFVLRLWPCGWGRVLVLVTGMVPRENNELNALLALPVGSDGFYKEVHQKLRPVETNITGLLIAGTAQAPKDIKETLSSGSAASSKAAAFALKKELELEPFVAAVDPSLCEASQLCIKECPYGAIEMNGLASGLQRITASVNIAKCKGCGACVAVCPTEAIQLQGFMNREIRAMIGALAR